MATPEQLPNDWRAPDGWSSAPTYYELSASSDGLALGVTVIVALSVGALVSVIRGWFGTFLVVSLVVGAVAGVAWCVLPRTSVRYVQHYPYDGATTWVMETITTRQPSPLELLLGREDRSTSRFEEREGDPAPDFP